MSHGGNPKDFVGASKAPLSPVSRRVMHLLGLAMLEGECKYWRHNYRAADVRATVYIDAMERHVSAWIEGQDIDPDSNLPHLIKAMACLHIICDAQLFGSLVDDRPPAQANPDWMAEINAKALEITQRLGQFQRGAYTETNRAEWPEMSAALNSGPIKKSAEAPIDTLQVYLPKKGERVRIVEVAPFDARPYHEVGWSYETLETRQDRSSMAADTRGWIFFISISSAGGTWCRVAPG